MVIRVMKTFFYIVLLYILATSSKYLLLLLDPYCFCPLLCSSLHEMFSMISVHFQGKPFNITVIQVYAPISHAEEAEVERF